jgi:hypothetical protein
MNLPVKHRRLAILLSPSIVLLSLFLLIFQVPLIKHRKQLDAKYHKLAAKVSRLDFQSQTDKLGLLKKESDNLFGQSSHDHGSSERMLASPQVPIDSKGAAVPAAALEELLKLFESHQLVCIATSPLSGLEGRSPASGSPVPSGRSAGPKKDAPVRVQVQVQGSFQAMREALLDLKTRSSALRVSQLEMAEVEAIQEREWLLTVHLKETLP